MLINRLYFTGELNIPNSSNAAVSERLDAFIKKYEPEFLRDIMGYSLHTAYAAGVLVTPVDARWTDLQDGKEFTVNTKLNKWTGLVDAVNYRSPIANYVYYWYMRDQATQSTAVGEVATKTENSNRVSPAIKMSSAWNEMVYQIWDMWYFLENNKTVYPEWTFDARRWDKYRTINPYGV
jgi:hypothetical protein